MKYWKNTSGECGTMGNNDNIYPDGFSSTTKKKYDEYVSTQEKQVLESSDIEKLVEWAKRKGHI